VLLYPHVTTVADLKTQALPCCGRLSAIQVGGSISAYPMRGFMTSEEALITILRLIDGSDEVNDEKILQMLLRSIKTLAEKGLGREPT
jgi:hypothetical protein